MTDKNYCPCGSLKNVKHCCEPFILQATVAESPEALMRSRYTAYVLKNYPYIFDTYSRSKQQILSVDEIEQAAMGTQWLGLKVLSAFAMENEGEVEFIAYYKINQDFYQMHEHSYFLLEDNRWKYDKGDMLHKTGKLKVSRNQPCFCGSGLKFKRCCFLK